MCVWVNKRSNCFEKNDNVRGLFIKNIFYESQNCRMRFCSPPIIFVIHQYNFVFYVFTW